MNASDADPDFSKVAMTMVAYMIFVGTGLGIAQLPVNMVSQVGQQLSAVADQL